mgnify:CR=1 FL=1
MLSTSRHKGYLERRGVPNWDYVRETVYEICDHYDSLSHLGLDVIVTDKGFILCEINSKPALNYEQVMNGPALLDPENRVYFETKGLYNIDKTRFWTIYQQCQK